MNDFDQTEISVGCDGDVDIGWDTEFGAEAPKGSKLLAGLRGWWARRQARKVAVSTHPRPKQTSVLNQRITSNLTDSDNELEALEYAQSHDPYALGQPL